VTAVIDRREGEYWVLELPGGGTADLPIILLPQGNEGDVVEIRVDPNKTETRQQGAEERLQRLFGRDK
jgi:hypothetical protein